MDYLGFIKTGTPETWFPAAGVYTYTSESFALDLYDCTVTSLGVYAKASEGTGGGAFLMQIRDAAGNILAEGAGGLATSVTNSTAQWVDQAVSLYGTPVLGTKYYARILFTNENIVFYSELQDAECAEYYTTYYNSESLPTRNAIAFRVGVSALPNHKRALLSGLGGITGTLKGYLIGSQIGLNWIYQSAAFPGPPSAMAVAAGATGSLSGSYSAVVTDIDRWGNESNGSPDSAEVALSGQQLLVTVTSCTDPSVTLRGIYVLSPKFNTYRFVGTHSNTNVTSTYTVSLTDTEIGSGDELVTTNDPMPAAKYLKYFNDMLIVAGDRSSPDKVIPSNPMFHRQFDPNAFSRVVTGDGQPIKGFGEYFGNVIVGKSDSYYIGSGDESGNFRTKLYNPEKGMIGQPSIISFLKRLCFFADDGIYSDAGNLPVEMSKIIRHKIQALNNSNLTVTPPKQVSAHSKYYKRLMFSVREASGQGENDAILVYNYESETWTIYRGVEAVAFGLIRNNQDRQYLWGGDSKGKVYRFKHPADNLPNIDSHQGYDNAIDAYFVTPWIHLPRARGIANWDQTLTEAAWVDIYAGGETIQFTDPVRNYITLRTTVFLDKSTVSCGTYSTTHTAYQWPTVTCEPKTIQSFSGNRPFTHVKLRIENTEYYEHFKIHKLVFGFRARPTIAK
jgi:hypothetical protein